MATACQRSGAMVPERQLQDRRHLLADVDWDYDRFRTDHLASYLKVTRATRLSTPSRAVLTALCRSGSDILPDHPLVACRCPRSFWTSTWLTSRQPLPTADPIQIDANGNCDSHQKFPPLCSVTAANFARPKTDLTGSCISLLGCRSIPCG